MAKSYGSVRLKCWTCDANMLALNRMGIVACLPAHLSGTGSDEIVEFCTLKCMRRFAE
jgi:hypothetical protein